MDEKEIKMRWRQYLRKRYVEYRGDATGNKRNKSDFAREIGVSPQLFNDWMPEDETKENKLPKHKTTIDKLVKYFGPEVYDVLELPRPGLLESIDRLIETIPANISGSKQEGLLQRIERAIQDYVEEEALYRRTE